MKILLTNDDGIHAPGLQALVSALENEHEIRVVAPETEQSAIGHAITLTAPIRVKKVNKNGNFFGYALGGTPSDCVRIAVSELIDTPDLIVSGINLGGNVGINILYSGTVSAATEAAIMGFPSLSVSLNTYAEPEFSPAADFIRRLIPEMMAWGLEAGVSLNVNVPGLPYQRIQGVAWTNQLLEPCLEDFSRRVDPRGNTYYWRGREKTPETINPNSDYALLEQGFITLTPLRHDLTHHRELNRLKNLKIEH